MIYNDIALFTAVASRLSFSEAARQTGVPLSRVSRRVAELEEHLGVKLFERTTRRVRLTEEGRRLLDRCQAPIEALQDLTGFADGGAARRTIRVTAPPLAARTSIGPRLLDFAAGHPDVTIDLTTTNAVLDFFRDNVDLAFRLGPLDDSSLVARRLWSVPYCFCAGTAFAAQHDLTGPASPDRLAAVPAVMSRQPWRLSIGVILRPLNVVHRFDDLDVVQDAVRRNLGVGMLPREMVAPGMHVVPLIGAQALQREMYAVYPSRRLLPGRVRSLIDFMTSAEAQDRQSVRSDG